MTTVALERLFKEQGITLHASKFERLYRANGKGKRLAVFHLPT